LVTITDPKPIQRESTIIKRLVTELKIQ
jgi:hypothetical protein